jgi:hypothetical protein
MYGNGLRAFWLLQSLDHSTCCLCTDSVSESVTATYTVPALSQHCFGSTVVYKYYLYVNFDPGEQVIVM